MENAIFKAEDLKRISRKAFEWTDIQKNNFFDEKKCKVAIGQVFAAINQNIPSEDIINLTIKKNMSVLDNQIEYEQFETIINELWSIMSLTYKEDPSFQRKTTFKKIEIAEEVLAEYFEKLNNLQLKYYKLEEKLKQKNQEYTNKQNEYNKVALDYEQKSEKLVELTNELQNEEKKFKEIQNKLQEELTKTQKSKEEQIRKLIAENNKLQKQLDLYQEYNLNLKVASLSPENFEHTQSDINNTLSNFKQQILEMIDKQCEACQK